MKASESNGKKELAWVKAIVPLAVLAIIWFVPPPEGLTVEAWRMFGIFAATILGILFQPLPSGAIMMLAVSFTALTKILSLSKALSGFASSTVWLIFSAYVLSMGFLTTGLGHRIAYKLLSLVGGKTLGIAYALGVADLIMAPAMPSVTARSAGIVFPVARSINEVFDSRPGPTGKKIGNFLTMTCFQYATITGAMFMTGMAANPLAAELAKSTLGVEISWSGWFYAAVVPALVCFFVMPLLVFRLETPEIKSTPEARQMGEEHLAQMGKMTTKEWILTGIFILALLGWGTSLITDLNATTVGLAIVALILAFRVVEWKDVLKDHAAWDTVIWFGAIISLATGLTDLGFIDWLAQVFSNMFSGWSWVATFVALGLVYIYIHYAFATASGHTAALYPPFAMVAVAAGAPPMMVAICFGIFSNLMWGLTEYGGGPGPIYFGVGYFDRPTFYKINLAVTTVNVLIVMVIGMLWWTAIGLY